MSSQVPFLSARNDVKRAFAAVYFFYTIRTFFFSHQRSSPSSPLPSFLTRSSEAKRNIQFTQPNSPQLMFKLFYPPHPPPLRTAAAASSPLFSLSLLGSFLSLASTILFSSCARVFVSFPLNIFHWMRTNFPSESACATAAAAIFRRFRCLRDGICLKSCFWTHTASTNVCGGTRTKFLAERESERDEMMIWRDIQYFFHIIFLLYLHSLLFFVCSMLFSNSNMFRGRNESGEKKAEELQEENEFSLFCAARCHWMCQNSRFFLFPVQRILRLASASLPERNEDFSFFAFMRSFRVCVCLAWAREGSSKRYFVGPVSYLIISEFRR